MSTVAAATTMTGKHFIGGQWRRQQRATLESHNPAHWDEIIGVFPAGGAEEANQAVVAARAAFPGWRHTSRIHRADLFDNLAQLVKRDVDKLAELMARECGKVLSECLPEGGESKRPFECVAYRPHGVGQPGRERLTLHLYQALVGDIDLQVLQAIINPYAHGDSPLPSRSPLLLAACTPQTSGTASCTSLYRGRRWGSPFGLCETPAHL